MPGARIRIGIDVFKGVQIALYALAILAAITRTYIRIRYLHRLYIDDACLLLAVITLTAHTLLIFADSTYIPNLYTAIKMSAGLIPIPSNAVEIGSQVAEIGIIDLVLDWTTIFAVKFSFLFFFKNLLRRVRWLTVWWWIVVAIMTPAAGFSMGASFITCSKFNGLAALERCAVGGLQREHSYLIYSTSIDIVTDVLLLTIPILLLWNVKIRLPQKLGLAMVLCLSVVMIIFAIIRVCASEISGGVIDFVWGEFWQFAEACIAVLMVSCTAFRSLFVTSSPKPSPVLRPEPKSSSLVNASTKGRWGLTRVYGKLPSIPSATMTGIRTVIRRGGVATTTTTTTTEPFHHEEDWPLKERSSQNHHDPMDEV